jgi:GNAT superfamily N-acetyltransferase
MAWNLTNDVVEYLARVETFLHRDPAGNTLLLSVVENLRAHGTGIYGDVPALFGWWRSGDDVGAAFLVTSPQPVLLGDMPAHLAAELAGVLADRNVSLSGVNGGSTAAAAFATEWGRRTGVGGEVAMSQRLYRLDGLEEPVPLDGAARIAGGRDHDLVLAWFEAFAAELDGVAVTVNSPLVEDRIGFGGVALWEVDGVPVSMAARTRVLAGTARVAPVYTPVEHRRHGYGAAATATITRSALEAGAREVVLFTDLANPTSNSIYQRLGYRPVHDRLVIAFTI